MTAYISIFSIDSILVSIVQWNFFRDLMQILTIPDSAASFRRLSVLARLTSIKLNCSGV
jgi:hypothetical protein